MPVSKYFSNHIQPAQENDLLDSLVIETIMQRGFDLWYSPRDTVHLDDLFGEDPSSIFQTAIELEMLPTEVDSFGGEGSFASMMGLDIRDEFSLTVSKTRFRDVITKAYPTLSRPMEGDLILVQMSGDSEDPMFIFEITFCEHELPFYQLGSNRTFDLTCKKFEYSYEEMNTGITEVDDIEDEVPEDDSTDFQTEADAILDFSETDPFNEDGPY